MEVGYTIPWRWKESYGFIQSITKPNAPRIFFHKNNISKYDNYLLQSLKSDYEITAGHGHVQFCFVTYDEYEDKIKGTKSAINVCRLGYCPQEEFMENFDIERTRELIRLIREKCNYGLNILVSYPGVLRRDPSLFAELSPEGLDFYKNELKDKNFFDMAFCNNTNEDFRSKLYDYGEDTWVLKYRKGWTSKRIIRYIEEIDPRNRSQSKTEEYQYVLNDIEADSDIDVTGCIVQFVFRYHIVFDPYWWKIWTDSVKVRIIIVASNMLSQYDTWKDNIDILCRDFGSSNDNLALPLLLFLKISQLHSYEDKQAQFLFAHERLMDYISAVFSSSDAVSHSLNTLLDTCRKSKKPQLDIYRNPKKSQCFCDAKQNLHVDDNSSTEPVFCPRSRVACDYYAVHDISSTKYSSNAEKRYRDQQFIDFLTNVFDGFIPDLTALGIKPEYSWQVYSFRINAAINTLLSIGEHRYCLNCHSVLKANFKYSKKLDARLSATVFYCERCAEAGIEHYNESIYINYCSNSNCNRIIDSRECKIKTHEHGSYLCMYCGAGSNKDIVLVKPGEKCPCCGNTDGRTLFYDNRYLSKITCRKCHHNELGGPKWNLFHDI